MPVRSMPRKSLQRSEIEQGDIALTDKDVASGSLEVESYVKVDRGV